MLFRSCPINIQKMSYCIDNGVIKCLLTSVKQSCCSLLQPFDINVSMQTMLCPIPGFALALKGPWIWFIHCKVLEFYVAMEKHRKRYLILAFCPGIMQIYPWKYKNSLNYIKKCVFPFSIWSLTYAKMLTMGIHVCSKCLTT